MRCDTRVDGKLVLILRRCPWKAIVLTRQNGFLETSSGLSGSLLPMSAFQATALVAPPSEGLEHGANTIPDMNSTINGAEQDWFHLLHRVAS